MPIDLQKIQTQLKAPRSQYNDFGKYAYRSCEDILEAVKPLLAEQNASLIIYDEIVPIGDRYYVKATANIVVGTKAEFYASAFAREPEHKKGMDESQITGAASSYARKYALNGLFAIDDSKDADALPPGNSEPPKKQENSTSKQKRPFTLKENLQRFQGAKERIRQLDGKVDAYYECLNSHGVEKSNEFKTTKKQLACLSDLAKYVERREADGNDKGS